MMQKPLAEEHRARAEAKFKIKEQQKTVAPVAMREYLDGQQAERDKTERLRALRLARRTGE